MSGRTPVMKLPHEERLRVFTEALTDCEGNAKTAAAKVGLSYQYFRRCANSMGLAPSEFRSTRYKKIIELSESGEHRQKEIAAILNCSRSQVQRIISLYRKNKNDKPV